MAGMKRTESKSSQLYAKLKSDILSGRYSESCAFPSEVALSRRFGVSRSMMTNVVRELERDGLVARYQGCGTFVTKHGASRKIGLLVPGVSITDFFKPIVSEINRLACKEGYDLRFREIWSNEHEGRLAQMRDFVADFIKGSVAGVIYEPLAGATGDELNSRIMNLFDKKKIPVVLLDCDIVQSPERSHYDVVGVNDFEAGASITRHLLSVGAKRIHFLIGSLQPATFLNRLAGARSALALAGAKVSAEGNVLHAEADDLKALVRYLRRQKRKPDAFVCCNDAIAAVFKLTLERAGLKVPEDVMLTGFADLPIASLMTPTLTTVRQNREHMAQTAFRRLVERIDNPSLPPCEIFLPAPLVVRDSTKGRRK
jgi:LacI family transcriptional regulator